MHTQEKHSNYSCDDSFEEIGDTMVNTLCWSRYFRQNSQGRLSEEMTFKLELEKKKTSLEEQGKNIPGRGQQLV